VCVNNVEVVDQCGGPQNRRENKARKETRRTCFYVIRSGHGLPILPPVSYRKCVLVAMSGSAVVNRHDKLPLGASSVRALDL